MTSDYRKHYIGVDKVKLFTDRFRIHQPELSGLQLMSAPVDLATGETKNQCLFGSDTGQLYHGSRAIKNTKLYNLTINSYGLTLQFNPSKPYHPYELVGDDETFNKRFYNVVEDLEQSGISADWDTAKLTRVDVSRNVQLWNPVSAYSNVFPYFRMKRAKHTRQHPDGYGTGNDNWGVIMYDKGKENRLFQDEHTAGQVYQDDNLLRCELQFKRNRSISTYLSVGTVRDIQRNSVFSLADKYREHLQDSLFNGQVDLPEQMSYAWHHELEVLRRLRSENPRTAINKHLFMLTYHLFEEKQVTPDLYSKLIEDAGFSRMTANRISRKLKRLVFEHHCYYPKGSIISNYINEIRSKLVA